MTQSKICYFYTFFVRKIVFVGTGELLMVEIGTGCRRFLKIMGRLSLKFHIFNNIMNYDRYFIIHLCDKIIVSVKFNTILEKNTNLEFLTFQKSLQVRP